MKYKENFPKFIAPWSNLNGRIEVRSTEYRVTFEGMDVNSIQTIENLCSGNISIEDIILSLSKEWDKDQISSFLNLCFEKKIIVNIFSINKLALGSLRKIEVVVPKKHLLKKLNLNYQIIFGSLDSETWSSGKDLSLDIARKKLISEVVEWNIWSSKEKIFTSSAKNIVGKYIQPMNIVNYTDAQYAFKNFPFKKFKKTKKYNWIQVKNLTKNELVYILADHVLFPFIHKHQYTKTTSSGSAAHSEKEKVLSHALYEIIERDAFMIFWLNKLDIPSVLIESLPPQFISRISNLHSLNYEVIIKNIGLDISPVIMVCVRTNRGNYVTTGISSSSDLVDMLDSALSEVEVSILHLLSVTRNKEERIITPEEVCSLEDHEKIHRQSCFSNQSSFIFKKDRFIKFSDVQIGYKVKISERLETLGFEILELDASNWEFDFLLPEFRFVSRVFVPGLIPLSYGYGNEPLGMERLHTVPKKLGLKSFDLKRGEFNRFPHPFN